MKSKHNVKKPKNEIEFKNWLKETLDFNIDSRYSFYYDTVIKQLKIDFEQSNFWGKVLKELQEINDKYFLKKGVHLLIPSNKPIIFTKNLDSLVNKAFRKNIINNVHWVHENRSTETLYI